MKDLTVAAADARGGRAFSPQLPKLDATQLTLGVGVLYILGFVVANVHFGRYELPRLELLRTRYLSAALLLIVCSMIPFSIGIFISQEVRRRQTEGPVTPPRPMTTRRGWDRVQRPVLGAIILGFFITLHLGLLSWISLDWRSVFLPGAEYFVVCGMWGELFSSSYLRGPTPAHHRTWAHGGPMMASIFVCVLTVFAPAVFSESLYESIRSEFGGGAVWVARIDLSDSVAGVTHDVAIDSIAIIDRDSESLSLLACARSTRSVRRVVVPVRSVADLWLIRQVAARNFGCR